MIDILPQLLKGQSPPGKCHGFPGDASPLGILPGKVWPQKNLWPNEDANYFVFVANCQLLSLSAYVRIDGLRNKQ